VNFHSKFADPGTINFSLTDNLPWTRWRGRGAAETLAGLCGSHREGEGYRGYCPVHGGKSGRSFVIHVGDKTGKIVAQCFGCPDCGTDEEGRRRLCEEIQSRVDSAQASRRDDRFYRADAPAFRAVGQRQGQPLKRGVEFAHSVAYAALGKAARKLLRALENINVMGGGKLNGCLSPTYDVLERRGVRRKSIAPAMRSLKVVGILKTRSGGYDWRAKRRRPSVLTLTYLPAWNAPAPTDDWLACEPKDGTPKAWETALKMARAAIKTAPRNAPGGVRKIAPKKPPLYKNAPVVEEGATGPAWGEPARRPPTGMVVEAANDHGERRRDGGSSARQDPSSSRCEVASQPVDEFTPLDSGDAYETELARAARAAVAKSMAMFGHPFGPGFGPDGEPDCSDRPPPKPAPKPVHAWPMVVEVGEDGDEQMLVLHKAPTHDPPEVTWSHPEPRPFEVEVGRGRERRTVTRFTQPAVQRDIEGVPDVLKRDAVLRHKVARRAWLDRISLTLALELTEIEMLGKGIEPWDGYLAAIEADDAASAAWPVAAE
jgi:hypothetical protein